MYRVLAFGRIEHSPSGGESEKASNEGTCLAPTAERARQTIVRKAHRSGQFLPKIKGHASKRPLRHAVYLLLLLLHANTIFSRACALLKIRLYLGDWKLLDHTSSMAEILRESSRSVGTTPARVRDQNPKPRALRLLLFTKRTTIGFARRDMQVRERNEHQKYIFSRAFSYRWLRKTEGGSRVGNKAEGLEISGCKSPGPHLFISCKGDGGWMTMIRRKCG